MALIDDRQLVNGFIAVTSITFGVSVLAFKFIDDRSLLDSVYLTVVTISTVGFGDIAPKHPSTKIITLLLIVNGLAAIGIASQLLLDRIIKAQLNRQYLLPRAPIDTENHIVIGGYGAKGRRVAELFRDRTYKVIVVELDDDRAKLAEFHGFQVIKGDLTKPTVLEILSLEKAAAFCLFLSNDNFTIQSGILARSISESIDIYAEISSLSSYNIARFAGINKPISLMNFLANMIQSNLSHRQLKLLYSIKELRVKESSLGFVQVHLTNQDVDVDGMYPIGYYSNSLNELGPAVGNSHREYFKITGNEHLLYAIAREELDQKFKDNSSEITIHKRIVFAGYTPFFDSIINRINDGEEREIIVLYETDEELEKLSDLNCKKIQWEQEYSNAILSNIIENDDLVISSFTDITDALILAVFLKSLEKSTHLIQLVPYEYDIEAFVKVGAEAVITPQRVVAEAVMQLFLEENNLPPSLVFTNGHLFEHRVQEEDYFINKKVKELYDKGYEILYRSPHRRYKFKTPDQNKRIKLNDTLLIWISQEH